MRILCLCDVHGDRGAATPLPVLSSAARRSRSHRVRVRPHERLGAPSHHKFGAARGGRPRPLSAGNPDHREECGDAVTAAGWHAPHGGLREDKRVFFAAWVVHLGDALPSSDRCRQVVAAELAALGDAVNDSPGHLVIVTHVPPRETACAVDRRGIDRGSVQLRRWIEEHQPAVVVCGHVHHREVVLDRIGQTVVVNPGPHGQVLDLP
jgi:hypothetical protein